MPSSRCSNADIRVGGKTGHALLTRNFPLMMTTISIFCKARKVIGIASRSAKRVTPGKLAYETGAALVVKKPRHG